MLVTGENIIQCFQTVRDQVVFTDKRVIVVNVQGITGKKTSYFSYPYSKVLYFGIETAGVLDIDSELIMTFANGTVLQFDFRHQRNLFKYTAVYFIRLIFKKSSQGGVWIRFTLLFEQNEKSNAREWGIVNEDNG